MSEGPEINEKQFRKVLKNISESANARTVFGDTVVLDGHAVIPVARVNHKGGGGYGSGSGAHEECGPDCPPDCHEHIGEGTGAGMGLGYMVEAEPVGVIEVTVDGVRWIPTLDFNRLAIIGATVASVLAVVFAAGQLLDRR